MDHPQSRGMYEPMAMLRSLAELHHKFQPVSDQCSGTSFSSPQSTTGNYEEALNKAIEDGDYKNAPSFLAEENQVKVIDYKGEKVASFVIGNVEMICLPQVYELFLKTMVGGLHTVYTKLKRLEISPLVCNVEQVRALRSLGAIQPGVNRCKLIAKSDFDLLHDDCTSSCNRPGRPAKRVTDDWLAAQQSLAAKQSKIELGSPPISQSQSTPFSTEALLNSNSSNLLGSSLLSGMNSLTGQQSALLGLLPGFNQMLMQQVLAQAKIRENHERDCENEEDEERRERIDEIREEEEKEEREESHSGTEDSPMSNKSASNCKREQKSETRSRDDSSSRDESKSLSPNNNSTTLTSSDSGRSSQNQMNTPDFTKLISLLENTVEQFKKREEMNDEKERRERAERQLAIERKRTNLYIIRWNRTRRELASLQQRIQALEQTSHAV